MLLRLMRVIGIIAFLGIIISVIIFLFIVPVEKIIEFLFIMHKKVLIVMGILFIGSELILFILGLFKKNLKKIIDIKELIKHLIWSLIFFILLFANITTFEMLVLPHLIKIEILVPQDKAEIANLVTDVKVFVMAVEDQSIYITVKTPQGTLWTQDKLFTSKFKDELTGIARLGEGEVGIGEMFKIFAIATKKDLPIGVLERIPPDAIHSKNTVTVKRVG
jgi:hypothetical protein